MSALFQRLHARGHGGPGAEPKLKLAATRGAWPDLVPAFDSDGIVDQAAPDSTRPITLFRQAEKRAASSSHAVRPVPDAPSPAPEPPAASHRIAGTAMPAVAADTVPPATQADDAARPVRAPKAPSVSRRSTTISKMSPHNSGRRVDDAAPPTPVPATPDPPPDRVRDTAQRIAPVAEAARPATATSPLDRLFAALETPPAPRAPEAAAASTDPPTSVSIGRIDISVAPPPPPATRSGPARTQGFAHYAGVRRGLER